MSHLSDGRLIDILCGIEASLLGDDFLDKDLSRIELVPGSRREGKKKLAFISGIAAGSVALTGVIVYLIRKHDMLRAA